MMDQQWEEIRRVYDKQKANRWKVALTTAQERIAKMLRIKKSLWQRREEVHAALYADFGKHAAEADLTEILPAIAELKHSIKHLPAWMKPHGTKTPLLLTGTSSHYRYEPKGMVLILSPWNYPVSLLLNPLVSAIAAGNVAIIKPSSKVPNTSKFLKSFFASLFPEEEVALFEGSSAIANALLELKFDHIFFTGSPRIGKSVLAAAARHLTPVTLELGGKSPVIIDETANLKTSAERLMWGKFINAGQTCVAPDYAMVQETCLQPFIEQAVSVLQKRFGLTSDDRHKEPSLCRMISQGNLQKLQSILQASLDQGAKIAFGGVSDAEGRFMEPTLLTEVNEESPIMQEEIFGPILPIMTYRELEEPIRIIQSKSKPLALYIFSQSNRNIQQLLKNTISGGTCINTVVLHLINLDLPFGGVGESGMGNYHGFHGFKTLSHQRAVLKQSKLDLLRIMYPPYTSRVAKLIQLAIQYLV